MTTDLDHRPHALYRFFAADGTLLYVGITANVGSRWKSHSNDKPWWSEVASTTIEHFPDRASALRAETRAIKVEKPKYNVIHNWRWADATELAQPGVIEKPPAVSVVAALTAFQALIAPPVAVVRPKPGCDRVTAVYVTVATLCWAAWFFPYTLGLLSWLKVDGYPLVALLFGAYALSSLALKRDRVFALPLAWTLGSAGMNHVNGALTLTDGQMAIAYSVIVMVGVLVTIRMMALASERLPGRGLTFRREEVAV